MHDLLMKMILTGMLIYIPPTLRAGIAAIICVVACCDLNYFRPHKSIAPFWLSQVAWVATTAKYVTALLLSANTDARESSMIGQFLIGVDVTFMGTSVCSLFVAAWVLRHKVRALEKRIRRRESALKNIKDVKKLKQTDVMPVQSNEDLVSESEENVEMCALRPESIFDAGTVQGLRTWDGCQTFKPEQKEEKEEAKNLRQIRLQYGATSDEYQQAVKVAQVD